MACGSCGGNRTPRSTARVATTSPVRYVVKGKKFATLTAAQDFARTVPGAVIRQV